MVKKHYSLCEELGIFTADRRFENFREIQVNKTVNLRVDQYRMYVPTTQF